MAASDYLTDTEKRAFLESLRAGYARDVMRNCLELGIDYETFDHTSYVVPEPITAHAQTLLGNASVALTSIEAKLAAL